MFACSTFRTCKTCKVNTHIASEFTHCLKVQITFTILFSIHQNISELQHTFTFFEFRSRPYQEGYYAVCN